MNLENKDNYKDCYFNLFNTMKSGIVIYKAIEHGNDFIFKDLNKAAEKINNIKRVDVLNKKISEIFPKVNEFGILDLFKRVWKSGQPELHPISQYEDNKIIKWIENYVYKLPNGEIVAVYEDRTKEKQAEKEFQKVCKSAQNTAKRLETLLEATKKVLKYESFEVAAKKIFDQCKEMIGASSGYVALLSDDGLENEVLFLDSGGLPCSVDPALPMPIRGLRGEVYAKGKARYHNDFMQSEWEEYMPEGHVILNNVLFAPLIIEGNVIGLMGLANKQHDFIHEDANIASAFSELAAISLYNSRLIDSLKQAQEKAEELYHYSELYKDIFSHDINNILQNILMGLSIIESTNNISEDKKKILKSLHEQIYRGSKLVENISQLSALQDKKYVLEDFYILDILNKAKKFVIKSHLDRKIIIEYSIKENYKIKANILIKDVFENLLFNSVKHNDNDIIVINVDINATQDGFLQIIFTDNGIGIPDQLKQKLFIQPIKKKENTRGMGLGLLLVSKIIKSFNGTISVKDRIQGDYSQGTKLVIRIPYITESE
ncbi:MAG: ATP-binding protein [Promethearchaeota archaeon]